MNNFRVQLRAMLSKNVALHKRYKAGIVCEYIFPLIILGFVGLYMYIFTVIFPITSKPYGIISKIHIYLSYNRTSFS